MFLNNLFNHNSKAMLLHQQITHDSKYEKKMASKMLREALTEGNANPERRIYFQFPSPSDHKNHLVGQV